MKHKNVIITGTGIYHPSNKIDNSYYIEHFKKLGTDITSFLDKLGVKQRYIINNDTETSLTMAIEASNNALKDAGISANELDAIIFSSDTPEYLCPSNALIINHELQAVNANTVYDLNCNCAGMIVALDQISRYMKTSKNVKYALVVGSIFESSVSRDDSKYTYPASGDGAAAVILKCIEEDTQRGILDSCYSTRSEYFDKVVSPACGLTKARLNTINEYDKKQQWTPFRIDFFASEWCKAIERFREDYNFSVDEIEYFFLSQYSVQYLIETATLLNIKNYEDRFPYIGYKYGYTGTTSPIFALHETLKNRTTTKGLKAIFGSAGAGAAMCSLLYEF